MDRQDLTTEYGEQSSVDDILAEFGKGSRPAMAFADGTAAGDEPEVRIYRSSRSDATAREAEEIREYRPRHAARYIEDPPEEEAGEPSYEPESSAEDEGFSSHVSRPSRDEIMDFLDAYKRGDFLDLQSEPMSEPDIRVDDRFFMGGSALQNNGMVYGDREIDMSADDDYEPPVAEDYFGYSDEDEDDDETEEEPLPRRRGRGLLFGKKSPAEPRETLRPNTDETDEGTDYADDLSYEPPEETTEPTDGVGLFPSFKEYLLSLLAAFLYRVRGGEAGAGTMADDAEEELGRELNAKKASSYYAGFLRSMGLRLKLAFAVLLPMAWISLGLPVTGMLKSSVGAGIVCLAGQTAIMMLALDVVTNGILNAVWGRPGADSLAVFSCLITGLDAFLVAVTDFTPGHLALCFVSSCALVGVLAASYLSCRALRKSIRVPAIGKFCYAVTGETNPKNGEVTIIKSTRSAAGFVRRSEEAPPDETVFRKLSLPLLVLCFLLTVLIAAVKRSMDSLIYIFSALLCAAVPFGALLSFALPYFVGSHRIFPSGAAVAGWSGAFDLGISRNLVVTDRDLFPEGTVTVESTRIFASYDTATVISYAGSLMTASGCSSAGCFGELMEKNGCTMRHVEDFEILPGGGMKGVIDSSVILCGSSDLMRLMNVPVPFRLVSRTSVLLAVDGVLCGIFNLKYEALPQVRKALVELIASNRHPVFAIRDFNVTPDMLRVAFDVATDGYDFPPYAQRFAMTAADPAEGSQIAAVVCREGLGPLVHTAATGRSMYTATRLNVLLTVISSLIGVLTVTVKLLSAGSVSVGFLFFFLLFWLVPMAASSFFMKL